MIKVISKVVMILELIAKNGDMSFTNLTNLSGLSRSNMSHLLKSLCENGLLIRKSHGSYGTGEKLYLLCASSDKNVALNQIVNRCVRNAMHEFNELTVVGMRHNGQRLTLVKSRPLKNHQVSESSDQYVTANWYNTASGRILLAFQRDEEIRHIVDKCGLPKKNEWSDAQTFERMMKEIAHIREQRAVFLDVDEYVSAIGVPVADASGEDALCISVAFLKMFCTLADQEIAERLRTHAEIMSKEIKFNGITISDLKL